ncbi:MAG: Na+/H+ antiporter NhaC family protein [Eubacteriales bacterium]|nr:Na+/H+ antiporter NhaC family protein [Eubacteriales bacterium]MDD4583168.1 Na+/H+ antiporter NhaC family protein [Eubacteriales bacterium]
MLKKLENEVQTFNARRSLIAVLIIIGISIIISRFLPDDPYNFGPASLIPALFLIVYIFTTKRILEALILASVMGFIMVSQGDVLGAFSGALLGVMMNEDIAWLFIVCGLMGSIITLIERAGGAFAFGEWVATKAKTRKSSLIYTWILGIIVFIDDYLNSLTVGSCMAPLTDKYKVPREFLSYVVDSTAAPLCVLIPITTWSIFCSRLLEVNGWAPAGDGLKYFILTIPFNFYAWIAAFIVPLIILGIIPIFGPMKKAEQRVKDGGPIAPAGSEKIDIRGGETMELPSNPKIMNFLLPLLVLVCSTIYFDLDMQIGVLCTMVFMFITYLGQNIMSAEEFTDIALKGLKNMILPLMLMVLAFLFAEVNDQIHFTYYMISTSSKYMTPALMPFIIFIVLAFTEFITGTNWGMYIIALPIVIPLGIGLEANMPLSIAAVLSAGVFGSHICFYSDATIITSAATGCNNFDHALTQAPFGILAAVLSAICFLIAGFIF